MPQKKTKYSDSHGLLGLPLPGILWKQNIGYNFLNDRFYTRFSILYNNNVYSIDYSIASGLGIACTKNQCAPAHFISTERAEAMYKCGRKQNLGEL